MNTSGGTDNSFQVGETTLTKSQMKKLMKERRKEKAILKHEKVLEQQKREELKIPPTSGIQPLVRKQSDADLTEVHHTEDDSKTDSIEQEAEMIPESTDEPENEETQLVECCSSNHTGVLENRIFNDDAQDTTEVRTLLKTPRLRNLKMKNLRSASLKIPRSELSRTKFHRTKRKT